MKEHKYFSPNSAYIMIGNVKCECSWSSGWDKENHYIILEFPNNTKVEYVEKNHTCKKRMYKEIHRRNNQEYNPETNHQCIVERKVGDFNVFITGSCYHTLPDLQEKYNKKCREKEEERKLQRDKEDTENPQIQVPYKLIGFKENFFYTFSCNKLLVTINDKFVKEVSMLHISSNIYTGYRERLYFDFQEYEQNKTLQFIYENRKLECKEILEKEIKLFSGFKVTGIFERID